MRTTIFYNKGQELDLTKSWFNAVPVKNGLLIDTIFFYEPKNKQDWTYTYDELMNMKSTFYVRKQKSGVLPYKTFKGLMTKLYEEIYQLNKIV